MFPLILDSKEQVHNWSTYRGDTEDAKISKDDLLEHIELGANLSETSVRGMNFMHLAAYKGWQEAVEKLNAVDATMKNARFVSFLDIRLVQDPTCLLLLALVFQMIYVVEGL